MPQNHDHNSDIDAIHAVLLEILKTHADGLSEYELFGELSTNGLAIFSKDAFANEHTLFIRHFVLFHTLYRLRDELLHKQQYLLEISALSIRLLPWQAGEAQLALKDPLRDYYLNIIELEKITPDDVAEMLGRFWVGYHAQEGRETALKILGLQDPVDMQDIRQQFRELAMRHHPDRGGDVEEFQEINAAMRLLERSSPVH
jgi:DnaJ-domain-containing protein 1